MVSVRKHSGGIQTANEDISLREQVKKLLLGKGIYFEWVHGGPHLQRVRNNFDFLIKTCPLVDSATIETLGKIVEIHDIGRILPGDHAANFAKVFDRIEIDVSEKEREEILFVVENHSKGLPGLGIKKAENRREILLGLLAMLDHMDAIGVSGFLRPLQWSIDSGKYLPILSKIKIEDLDRFVSGERITPEITALKLKEESIISHLIYNHLATYEIMGPIAHLLSKEFVREIKSRNNYLYERIDEMLVTMEDNDSLKE